MTYEDLKDAYNEQNKQLEQYERLLEDAHSTIKKRNKQIKCLRRDHEKEVKELRKRIEKLEKSLRGYQDCYSLAAGQAEMGCVDCMFRDPDKRIGEPLCRYGMKLKVDENGRCECRKEKE